MTDNGSHQRRGAARCGGGGRRAVAAAAEAPAATAGTAAVAEAAEAAAAAQAQKSTRDQSEVRSSSSASLGRCFEVNEAGASSDFHLLFFPMFPDGNKTRFRID